MREGEERSRPLAKRLRRTMTEAETVLWAFLRKGRMDGVKFRRQHPIGPYVADFACIAAKLVVEVDGATHASAAELAHDRRRTTDLEARGWRVVRVTNMDVFENLDGVWTLIQLHLQERPIEDT